MTEAQQTRSIETEFEIAAPVDAVWKALTDADELTNWFPLNARVKPGVGGSIVMTWGKELADCDHESLIRVWEENKHLQFVWIDATPPEQAAKAKANGTFAPVPVAVDFHLEAHGSTTRLRLVHTGFSPDPSWDHQYDGTVRGWQFELRGLKHYLENHRDTKRIVVHARQTFDQMSLSEAWDRLMSDDGLCAEGTVNALKPGDRYGFTMSTGDVLEGEIHIIKRPHDLCATVENQNNAFLRVRIDDPYGTDPHKEVNLWLSTYGLPSQETDALQQRWDEMMARLFATAPTV